MINLLTIHLFGSIKGFELINFFKEKETLTIDRSLLSLRVKKGSYIRFDLLFRNFYI